MKKLNNIKDFLNELHDSRKIVDGDVNAQATEWGELEISFKGKKTLKTVAKIGLIAPSTKAATTFRSMNKDALERRLGVTLAFDEIYGKFQKWRIMEEASVVVIIFT